MVAQLLAPAFPVDPADTIGLISGGVYPVPSQIANAAVVGAADTLYVALDFADFAAAINAVGCRVQTGGGAGALMKAVALPHDPVTRRPGPTALAVNNVGADVTVIGQILASFSQVAAVQPGQPFWYGVVFNNVVPLPAVMLTAQGLVTIARQLGLGVPSGGAGSQPGGFSTPFPFANDPGAANAFLGATWSTVPVSAMPALVYRGA